MSNRPRNSQESEDQFRTLADHMSQLAWMADAEGSIFWYNRRWYEFTGTTLQEVRGWGWTAVHHPDHVERVKARIRHSWETGEVWEDTFPLRGRDGQYRWFLSRAIPIRGGDGSILRWFGTNTDVTEQRDGQAALVEADRRKNEFLAILAHELRNPLGPLLNGLRLLEGAQSDPTTGAKVRSMMDRQLRHLVRLVDDLLDVSRITHGKLELRLGPLDLADSIRDAVLSSRQHVESAGHLFEVRLPKAPMRVQGDAVRITQVFSNLLINAARYTPSSGHIVVTAWEESGFAVTEVADDGLGIPPHMLEAIFEPFRQVKDARGPTGGLGLGLALARNIVQMHRGTISAASDGPGAGSRFIVRIPLASQADEVPAAPPLRSQVPALRRRVLVADDNVDAAESLAMLLDAYGHDVRMAHDGLQALVAAEGFRPDAAVLDIGMPGLDGYEVARQLRARPGGKFMRIIALSGYGQADDLRRSQEAGFDAHLVKPVDPESLASVICERPPG